MLLNIFENEVCLELFGVRQFIAALDVTRPRAAFEISNSNTFRIVLELRVAFVPLFSTRVRMTTIFHTVVFLSLRFTASI